MKWRGIRRDSIDIGKADQGLLAINTRFKVDGEMRRRRGLARTSIQRKAAGVTTISGFSAFQSNVMAALTDGDRIQGYQQPYSLWGDNPDYEAITLSGGGIFSGTIESGELVNSSTTNPIPNLPVTGSVISSGFRDLRFNVSTTFADAIYFGSYSGLSYSFAEVEFDADVMTVGGYIILGWSPSIYVYKNTSNLIMQANAGTSASYNPVVTGIVNARAELSNGFIRLFVNGSEVASAVRPGTVDANSLTISSGGTGQFNAKYFLCGGA